LHDCANERANGPPPGSGAVPGTALIDTRQELVMARVLGTVFRTILVLGLAVRCVTAQSVTSPWKNTDIGAPVLSGGAAQASGVFSIDAAGEDIWNTKDQFHFVYQQIAGDVEVT